MREFSESLPPAYRDAFSEEVIATHASLALRREGQPAAVAAFDAPRSGGQGLCIIASDRPGLLALMGSALVRASLEVIDAVAYTRRTQTGAVEAVALFWVAPTGAEPEQLAQRVEARLLELLTQGPRSVVPPPAASAPGAVTTVRFLEDASGALCTLEVETQDRAGLLLSLANALYAQRVQIVGSDLRTRDGKAFDRFDLTELDGRPIGPERRLAIQIAVLSAVQPGA